MGRKRWKVNHPLWNKLRKLDHIAAQRFPSQYDQGFGDLGLILDPRLTFHGYWCTPKNVLTFAHTGGNGVHFSFMVLDGEVNESSPIMITVPQAFAQPYFIGGENLLDFLSLGIFRGYFALEQLGYDLNRTLEAYNSPIWRPNDHHDIWVGYSVDEHQQKLLDFLRSELALAPWKALKRTFRRLQTKYRSRSRGGYCSLGRLR